MRRLLAATCLTPVAMFGATQVAIAATSISTATTAKVSTSTVNSGAPDDITITSAGSITPTSGPAVTIDSDHKVSNAGAITITGVNNTAGIQAAAGLNSGIANSGTITVTETAATDLDADDDGDDDGPFAIGNDRFGVHVTGAGTFMGTIANSGGIVVVGNNSAGVAVDGALAGGLNNSGTISVIGDNSAGIRLHGITGDVSVTGALGAVGENAVGLDLLGDVTGAVEIQSAVGTTGYRYTTLPASDALALLDQDDLLQAGSAVHIGGNVTKGIILDAPPADDDDDEDDEDDDGVADASEGTATLTTYGSAAALQIGSDTKDITINKVTGTDEGLIINGSVSGSGVYSGIAANGVQIRGASHLDPITGETIVDHSVTLEGGLRVNGAVSATSNNGSATALNIGVGADVQKITVTGSITGSGGGDVGSETQGIRVDEYGNVKTIDNSGTIAAVSGGTLGTSTAIIDRSGTLTTIQNTGAIVAGVAGTNQVNRVIALDLTANASGVTYRQKLSAVEDASAPGIVGDIRTGSGADRLDFQDGSATGDADLGEGDDLIKLSGDATYSGGAAFGSGNDMLKLAGTSAFAGNLVFGAGANSMTLGDTASFTGLIDTSGGTLALDVGSGRLNVTNTGTVGLASLTVGSAGHFAVNVDGTAGTATQYNVAGLASFGAGATVDLHVASLLAQDKSYTVIKAGTLTGADGLALDDSDLPFLFKADLTTDAAAGTATLDVARKTAGELGLNRSGAAAYDAVYAALGNDDELAGSFLQVSDQESFLSDYSSLLPDHAGGVFQSVTQGSRAMARAASDPNGLRANAGGLAFWLGQSTWRDTKDRGNTASYRVEGWGFSGGVEMGAGSLGTVGLVLNYGFNEVKDRENANRVYGHQYEGGGYWRGAWGAFSADAHATVGRVTLKSKRTFPGTLDGEALERIARGDWNGTLATAGGGLAYTAKFGKRWDLRPSAAIEYYRLTEQAHDESGGSDAFDLAIAKRKSDELAATGSATLGLNFGSLASDTGWARVELEGGWRQVVGGGLGDTTAQFTGGNAFTLRGDGLKSGFIARLRAMGGNEGLRLTGEVGAEQLQGDLAYSLRGGIRIAF